MNTITHAGQGARIEGGRSLRERFTSFFARIERARKARRDFESLRGANEHLLADIGLTRSDLDKALTAPFWCDPSTRLSVARRAKRS